MNAATQTAGSRRYVELYDTTLRDGSQGEGVAFSLADKLNIARRLDELGFDFIEGGYPLSNPKDAAFFDEARKLTFRHAKLAAFGMTRRKGVAAEDDPGMKALVAAQAPVITIVGKTWDLHVDEVLRVSREENLAMIRDSVAYCSAEQGKRGGAVFYDAEHFFDGYRANPDYATATLRAALEGGATRLVLCDTNGGSLPDWITHCVAAITQALGLGSAGPSTADPRPALGIHCHNDAGLAVANSLAAVAAGAVQVQGTINGIGERCGNVDLIPVAANLRLKLGHDCLGGGEGPLQHLTELSRYVYEVANLPLVSGQPYVGSGAFSHKGGMHVHAVQRIAHSYEHVPPQSVGNTRRVLVSELSGVSNIAATLGPRYAAAAADRGVQKQVLDRVTALENEGYQFEAALASFELLLHEALGTRRNFWTLDRYRCVITRRNGDATTTEAIVKLTVSDTVEHHVADGDGPINALDAALRRCLEHHYPALRDLHLADYRVRVVNPRAESAAKVRVIIDFRVPGVDGAAPQTFSTIGVNENIVDASWQALTDAFMYHLIQRQS